MTNKTDVEIVATLVRKQGLFLKPVEISGNLYIGFSHNLGKTKQPPRSITQDVAEDWLQKDILQCRDVVLKEYPHLASISKQRLAAILSFCLDMGISIYRQSTLSYVIEAGDWDKAKLEIVKWVNGGIARKARRNEEALLLTIE